MDRIYDITVPSYEPLSNRALCQHRKSFYNSQQLVLQPFVFRPFEIPGSYSPASDVGRNNRIFDPILILFLVQNRSQFL